MSRLVIRPQLANPEIIEIIRDSQALLAHILLMQTETGPNEKQRVRNIINRFRTLREKALETKSAQAERKKARPPDYSQAEIQAMEEVILDEKMPDRWSLRELQEWMESVGHSMQEILAGMDGEIKRIRQIEQVLVKARALTQVVAKLTDIRSGLEGRINVLREKQTEWIEKASYVENMERVTAEGETILQKSVELIGEQLPSASSEAPDKEPATQNDRFCFFHFAGKLFGLPSSNVMKIQPLTHKKALGILKRGRAGLHEFNFFPEHRERTPRRMEEEAGQGAAIIRIHPDRPSPLWAFGHRAGQAYSHILHQWKRAWNHFCRSRQD